ncbi:MAG: ATP-binding protein [Burkholderiales bacterium]|nr:ATP-binding protein [Burkholderiales bacterium]
MRRTLRTAAHALMALVLAGGWVYLYWQSAAADLAAVRKAQASLAELRALDARWNDQLLGAAARADPARFSDLERHRLLGARLEASALGLGEPALGAALAALRAAFDDKAERLARYGAALEALAAASGERGRLEATAEAALQEAWLASTGPRLDLVERTLGRAFDAALAHAELHRAWLLYYSGIVLAALAFALWSVFDSRRALDRANAQLREANETLEARVRERTRELSEALARLKESETMLVHSEKMASLGQMAAGLVHEVNTPLAYVKASMEAVARRTPELERLVADTEALLRLLAAENANERALADAFASVRARLEALRASGALAELARQAADGLFGIGRIVELIATLKTFSRLDRAEFARADLHEGLESALRIARHLLGRREVVKDFGRIAPVACAAAQINQVFLNLIANAAQATPEQGGRIALRTYMRDAQHVAVEVADNGHGIAPQALARIFDPFFTTKPAGQGTGLGLAISDRIVRAHGGRIEVQSAPGQGSRFTVVLPLVPPAPAAAA